MAYLALGVRRLKSKRNCKDSYLGRKGVPGMGLMLYWFGSKLWMPPVAANATNLPEPFP